jgi:hypothetical protein
MAVGTIPAPFGDKNYWLASSRGDDASRVTKAGIKAQRPALVLFDVAGSGMVQLFSATRHHALSGWPRGSDAASASGPRIAFTVDSSNGSWVTS